MELDEGYIDILCTVFICSDRSFVKEKLEGFPRGEGPPREKCSLVELLQILISLKLFQDKQLIKSFEKEKELQKTFWVLSQIFIVKGQLIIYLWIRTLL